MIQNKYALIERALQNPAILLQQEGGFFIASQEYDPSAGIFLAPDMPDNYPVSYPSFSELEVPDYMIPAATPEDLYELVLAYESVTGRASRRSQIRRDVEHEQEHAEAAAILGGMSTFFLKVSATEDCQVNGWQAQNIATDLATTKLGVGVITTYPRRLSLGDRLDVEAIGYNGAKDIAARARQNGLPIPLRRRGLTLA